MDVDDLRLQHQGISSYSDDQQLIMPTGFSFHFLGVYALRLQQNGPHFAQSILKNSLELKLLYFDSNLI